MSHSSPTRRALVTGASGAIGGAIARALAAQGLHVLAHANRNRAAADEVVAAIHAAQERVTITTPYFIPDEATLQALQTAVLRGVIVEVILPRKSDHWLVCAASRAYHEDLFRVGARIYLYEKGILHAKTVAVDDKIALIGSSNFDIRSFALNFEINLVCYGADVTERLRTEQQRYRRHSHRLTRRQFQARPTLRTFGQRVARLLSPLL